MGEHPINNLMSTVMENIRYGKLDATDEEIEQAADQAMLAPDDEDDADDNGVTTRKGFFKRR